MFAFIGNIGPWELVFILAIALIVVGPGKLPEVAKSMGKAVNEFKKSTNGVKHDLEQAMKFDDEPSKPMAEVKSAEPEIVENTQAETQENSPEPEVFEKKPEEVRL
ncbi:MAG TPA: twin-arginine translocase TatA/TatE family subunit [Syntrophomonadaceae bacterium]|nr:twin-arginine translocase TatA/TatE family subunit [Syntrophomonadaceae bacterium]